MSQNNSKARMDILAKALIQEFITSELDEYESAPHYLQIMSTKMFRMNEKVVVRVVYENKDNQQITVSDVKTAGLLARPGSAQSTVETCPCCGRKL